MKTIILIVMVIIVKAPIALVETYHRTYPFDMHGCKRHLEAIVKAVKDAGGEVKKNDGSERSYRIEVAWTKNTVIRH